jgi:glutathione synthase/RimK-type ligase-like ATP-grasp enzyme
MGQTIQSKVPSILILSSTEAAYGAVINDKFVQQLNVRLHSICTLEWQNYHNIRLDIAPKLLKVSITSDGRDISLFKAVYFKSYFRFAEQATAIAEILEDKQVTFIGNELRSYIPAAKLSQLVRLSRNGIKVPTTIYMSPEHYEGHYEELKTKLGEHFIFKVIDGAGGNDNHLVTSRSQLKSIVAVNKDKFFLAQAFIPNDSDLRVIVIAGQINLVIERRRLDNTTHLNNTSRGAGARLLPVEELSPALKDLALRATAIMKRDTAGVDIMLEKSTNTPYVLEVNASPQIASGAFIEEKLDVYTKYFRELASK